MANYKALIAIFCVVSQTEFRRIYSLTVSKEAWDLLEVTHEGTSAVKKSKLQMLTTRFEELKMEEDKQFIEFYTKLQDLVNSKSSLGDPLKSEAIVRKIFRLLLERFRSKVTAIEENKDIDKLVVEELVGSLQTFEMTLRPSAKKKGVTLKVEELTSTEENSDDIVAFIANDFRKFYKKNAKNFRRKFPSKISKDFFRRKEVPIEEVICYEGKGKCHYASDCANKKYKSKGKNKKAMTTT